MELRRLGDYTPGRNVLFLGSASSALPGDEGAEFVIERDRKAIRGHFQTDRLKIVGDQVFYPFEFLVTNEVTIRNFITNRLTEIFSAKVGLCIEVKFSEPLLDESTLSFFHSPMETVTTCLTTDEYFAHVDKLLTKINVFFAQLAVVGLSKS